MKGGRKDTHKNPPALPAASGPGPRTPAQILAAIEAHNGPLSLDDLIGLLKVSRLRDQEALAQSLVAMTAEGSLHQDRRGAFRIVRSTPAAAPAEPPAPVAAAVAMPVVPRKSASAHPPAPVAAAVAAPVAPRKSAPAQPPAPVAPAVAAPVAPRKSAPAADRTVGEDEEPAQLVGRLQVSEAGATVIPLSARRTALVVAKGDRGGAKNGQIVVAERLASVSRREVPRGRVVEVLGEDATPGVEIEAAIRAFELPHEWPAAVQRQARRLPSEVVDWDPREREDLRDLKLVTIDGADARDFDDAVCCQPSRGGRGWRLWVAIADVSSYVTPGTALDAEALNRGNSVYFPERVIPMLPEALSNGLCSLNPEVDRLCMVCEMRVDPGGTISKARFFQGVMRSQARLIYEDVAELLENPNSALARRRPELVEPLRALDQVYQALLKARVARGAIDFDSTETRIVFDEQRKIAAIQPVTRTRAHRLIEECMIAANVEAAQFAQRHQVPILYRVHARPDAEKIEVLREFLAMRGLQLHGGDQPQAGDFARLVVQLADRPDASLVQSVMLRSLMQARYSVENVGHFGLALEHYAHFTSPIRRYPDLLLHRAVKEILSNPSRGKQKGQAAALEAMGQHCSMTERRADDATRDVVSWLKCEYMSHRVGEEFAGVITAVVPFGLFVTLEGLFVEGLIHISRIGTDFFEYDAKRQRLVGARSHKTYSLGERLQVRLSRVSVEERKIDLEQVSSEGNGGAGQVRSQRRRGRSR